jgi:hypothetical protein
MQDSCCSPGCEPTQAVSPGCERRLSARDVNPGCDVSVGTASAVVFHIQSMPPQGLQHHALAAGTELVANRHVWLTHASKELTRCPDRAGVRDGIGAVLSLVFAAYVHFTFGQCVAS